MLVVEAVLSSTAISQKCGHGFPDPCTEKPREHGVASQQKSSRSPTVWQGEVLTMFLGGKIASYKREAPSFSYNKHTNTPLNVSSSYHHVVEIGVIFTFPSLLICMHASILYEISPSYFC